MTITPVQFVVASAIKQKSPLSSSANTPKSDAGGAASSSNNDAAIPEVSSKLIEASNLYNASVNLAGNNSQLDTANSGTQKIALILQSLQSVAAQISNSSDSSSLITLEAEFQNLYAQIDRIANETSFNGANLLDGSFSLGGSAIGLEANSQSSASVSIPNLSAQSLFGSGTLNFSTPQNILATLASIGNALDVVNDVNSNISSASNQLNFIVASVATAQANVYASASTLTESDLGNAALAGFITGLLNKPASSANAQTGKLSGKLLELIGE